jgi:hypothetical protein
LYCALQATNKNLTWWDRINLVRTKHYIRYVGLGAKAAAGTTTKKKKAGRMKDEDQQYAFY